MKVIANSRLAVKDDTYLDRIAKYVPVEVVSAFIAITGIANLDDAWLKGSAWICLLAAPAYVWRLAQGTDKPWLVHAGLSTIAFGIWALATSPRLCALYGLPEFAPAVGVILFTLVAGLAEPVK